MSDEGSGKATTRRRFVAGGAALLGGAVLAPAAYGRRRARLYARPDLTSPDRYQAAALRALRRSRMRAVDSLPFPNMAAGTDTMPEVQHIVAVMMENHSYDNILGMLGREPWQVPRGDGFTLAADGHPANSNPQANGQPLRAFRMPTTCQFSGVPSQEWQASHEQFANGAMTGFITAQANPTQAGSTNGPVAMGYWQREDLPFTYSLADTFPVGDRYFCSVLGQTFPNRRYWIAGTSSGMTNDGTPAQYPTLLASPANGTIFDRLNHYGISWADYAVQTGLTDATINLYPTSGLAQDKTNLKPISQFFSDAAAGTLPSYCIVDPNFSTESQENPQNIVVGEQWLSTIVDAVLKSPKWLQTVLIINYDEHGGYYDHVAPPVALAPDSIAPVTDFGESQYDGFRRYGIRVPAIVVSPYAKKSYVSHQVYDHTSVLAFVERKFNLPALTMRDANANDMTDFLDMSALAAKQPTFAEPPALAASSYGAATLACSTKGPGTIPVPEPKALALDARIVSTQVNHKKRALLVSVQASRAGLGPVKVALLQGKRHISSDTIHGLTALVWTVPMRQRGNVPRKGRYTLEVTTGKRLLARREVVIK